ncbi:MAG: alpha/beta fold hydrolase [Flavobacteriales bacterium]|nr:alpha/beta fold hydrolase [Flavobacteriales bacterium]
MSPSPNLNPSHKFFHSGELRVEYAQWGKGKEALVALHGFGRNLNDFRAFTAPFEDRFTTTAVNIFFHGKSGIGSRKSDIEPLSTDEFAAFFNAFLDHIGAKKAHIMGYSLGGRLAMKLAECSPERVKSLILLAPDGLVLSRWYALLSHSAPGRAVFRFFMRNNPAFFGLLRTLNKIGFISDRLRDFIRSQTGSPELQQKVYDVWCFLRKIEPEFDKLGRALKREDVPVHIFIGAYDRIIPIKNARKFKSIYPEVKITLLRSGHAMLTRKNAVYILENRLLDN